MVELILSLMSLAIAATLQPTQAVAMIILLQTHRGSANGSAYIAGMVVFRLVLGGASWVLLSGLEGSIERSGGKFSIFVGVVLAVLGLVMLAHALRRSCSAPTDDEVATSWMEKFEAASPRQAFLVGFAFLALDPRDWIIDISAVSLIADADLSNPKSFLVYLVYILMAHTLLWIPLLLTWVFAERARRGLAALNIWIKRREKSIEITVAIISGLLFLVIGLEHLDLIPMEVL